MLNICIKGNKKFFKNFKKNPKALGILLLIWQPKYFDFHNPIILNMFYNKNLRLVTFINDQNTPKTLKLPMRATPNSWSRYRKGWTAGCNFQWLNPPLDRFKHLIANLATQALLHFFQNLRVGFLHLWWLFSPKISSF